MELFKRAGRLRAALAVLTVLAGLGISACGSSSSKSSSSSNGTSSSKGTSTSSSNSTASAAANKSPFTELMVIDTSGPTKVYGTVDLASMQAAAKYQNLHGGILGHPIKVVSIDDNGDATTAVSA